MDNQEISFIKMHGFGNDFIVIKDLSNQLLEDNKFIARIPFLCDRHYGIGSDGLILIGKKKLYSYLTLNLFYFSEMYHYTYFSSNGSSQMCGNGLRCFLKFLFDHSFINLNEELIFSSNYGVKLGKVLTASNDQSNTNEVFVELGIPVFEPKQIPLNFCLEKEVCIDYLITLNNKQYNVSCVSFGNPHCVIFVDEFNDQELIDLGKYANGDKFNYILTYLICRQLFPSGVNIEMVKQIDEQTVQIKVYERAEGVTLACGTGACAVGIVCYLLKKTGSIVRVKMDGGIQEVQINQDMKTFMKASATTVFSGKI